MKTGEFVVLGQQIVAKKAFWPNDEDAESMGDVAPGDTAALPGSHAFQVALLLRPLPMRSCRHRKYLNPEEENLGKTYHYDMW